MVTTFLEWVGELGVFTWKLAKAAIRPPYEFRELLRQMDEIGSKSLPLVGLAGASAGIVLSFHTRDTLTRFGAKSVLPVLIVFSIIKEVGPMVGALIVAGRVGAGIGAELGSMKVTEQIDPIEVMGFDPYKLLAATRVLACTLTLPLLTIIADSAGILTGWIASTMVEPTSLAKYIEEGFKRVGLSDLLPPTFKTAVFGFIIGLIGCFEGMRTTGGTEGVG
ncbi:MAG: ABC transporter permease [Acidobacteria bacterium]|nr:ABC transporter permease [Acidobacteriota bacterium]